MKFRCERDLLADAVSAAGRAATNRGGALPVLSGVRLSLRGSRLEVTGTDIQLWISVTVGVDGSEDGDAVVPARIAQDVVKSLQSGAVSVTVADGELEITSGRFRSQIRTLPAEEFPVRPDVAESSVTVDAGSLSDALHQVVLAASGDDARPILTGVLFAAEGDGLRLVATDSYRLAVRDVPGVGVLGEAQQVLVPSRALREVERILDPSSTLTLRLSERDASFEVVDGGVTTRLDTRLIEGDFPNYRQLIPSEYPNELTVAREELAEAVRRVKLMAREGTPVRLSMSANGLELVAVTQDVGQASEAIDASYTGDELTVAFNPDYLLDGVDIATGDEVVLSTLDALKPAVLRSSDSASFLYLLMPVRVS
ncbi:MAG: DNA polymerase III subunit beta [Actinobacteria bacterium]|nr:DNA polymerase III subunit beta [Actinomycetota bacterium]